MVRSVCVGLVLVCRVMVCENVADVDDAGVEVGVG